MHRSYGTMNITTGEVTSFFDITQLIQDTVNRQADVKTQPRQGEMPHNGYRAFDNATCQRAFASFQYTSLRDGLMKMHQDN